jgi:hypothetical protein
MFFVLKFTFLFSLSVCAHVKEEICHTHYYCAAAAKLKKNRNPTQAKFVEGG